MKILYVTTISNTINAFLVPHIEFLVRVGHRVDVAFHTVQDVNPKIYELGCNVHEIEFDRSPLKIQNYYAYKKLKDLIAEQGYDVVHTHTPTASACVRLACRSMGKVKVIYTAHGFHFYKGAPFLNWLIYYPIERWLARYTDVLITINMEDYTRAKRSFRASQIKYIPGVGIDVKKFADTTIDRSAKRQQLGIPIDAYLMLSVGELNRNKNHETVIHAMAKLKMKNLYYIICGEGHLEDHLKQLTHKLGLEDKVRFLGFRYDVREIYKAADLFVFPSYREGLPVSLMEAIASGLPVICSDIRGNVDLVADDGMGFKIRPNDIDGIANAIVKIVNSERNDMTDRIGLMKFSKEQVLEELNNIYSSLQHEIQVTG